MYTEELKNTARAMVAPGKGLLAADESLGTIQKRFDSIGIENTEAHRRAYREMLFTTPGLAEHVSGVILFDETIRQRTSGGKALVEVLRDAGMIPGIKVDTGAKDMAGFPGEKVTEGLDGLRARVADYRELGARFAKWRAVITIGDGLPSAACIEANTHALARYAAICQEGGLVPIVEPEVLMDGTHGIETCYRVTLDTLKALFAQLHRQRVMLEGTILKPNMVIAGKDCPRQAGPEEVARRTIECFLNGVPAALPGIMFLSGGQDAETATANLNAMHAAGTPPLPWKLSFSYGRALQDPALRAWGGQEANAAKAQSALAHRARMNGLASNGKWRSELEAAA